MTPDDFAKALADRLGYTVEHVGLEDGRHTFAVGLPVATGPNRVVVWHTDVAAGGDGVRGVACALSWTRRKAAGGAEEMRPIVFLDIDGVIKPLMWGAADPAMVAALNRTTDTTGAAIVVHSSWRYHFDLDELRTRLAEMGVTGEVLAACDTPRHERRFSGVQFPPGAFAEWMAGAPTDHERAVAIWRWLRDNPAHDPGGRFVVLDDDPCLGHYVGTEHFVSTERPQVPQAEAGANDGGLRIAGAWAAGLKHIDGLTNAMADCAIAVLTGRRRVAREFDTHAYTLVGPCPMCGDEMVDPESGRLIVPGEQVDRTFEHPEDTYATRMPDGNCGSCAWYANREDGGDRPFAGGIALTDRRKKSGGES